MRQLATAALLGLIGSLAAAHTGHGFSGAHFHATELFVPGVLVALALITWVRRKK